MRLSSHTKIRYSLLLNKLSNHNLAMYEEAYRCIVTITMNLSPFLQHNHLTLRLKGHKGQTFY